MRAILRVLIPCAVVAIAASCDTNRLVAPSQPTIGPALRLSVLAGPLLRVLPGEPGVCPNDSKLLNGGPTAVFGEGDGTWWGLEINGLNAAGLVTDAQKIAYLNHVFGTSLGSLDQLEVVNQNSVEDNWDHNQNGYVCAYELRGTRAYAGDPFINHTYFGISDDKVTKK